MAQHSDPGAPVSSMAPAQPTSKSGAATPKLNNEVEMGELQNESAPVDIMQIARVGYIAAMEKMFEKGGYDATYTDEEGITPLHVRALFYPRTSAASAKLDLGLTKLFLNPSGRPSTTSTPCAGSLSSRVPR